MASAQYSRNYTFAHYKGVHGQDLQENGMQQVHEYHYYYYVKANESVLLILPVQHFTGSGQSLEPQAYFRWYDYNTDKASEYLSAYSRETSLSTFYDNSRNNRGLGVWELRSNPTSTNVGVTYKAPSDADSETWAGDVVACDVSRYTDNYTTSGSGWQQTGTYHEPTLSIRYIYHILPAKKLAKNQMNQVCTDGTKDGVVGPNAEVVDATAMTLENHKEIVAGVKDDDSEVSLRLDLQSPQRYYFYSLTDDYCATNSFAGKKHVYTNAANANKRLTTADFNTKTLYQANSTLWVVYDETKSKYCELSAYASNTSFLIVTIDKLKKATWKNVSDDQTTTAPTDYKGQKFYIVTYASQGWCVCPIANFELLLRDDYPMTIDEINQLSAAKQQIRKLDEIESNKFKEVVTIDFDNDNNQSESPDYSYPTRSTNSTSKPSAWDNRAYGFVYKELGSRYYQRDLDYMPVHGDYGLYKSANLSDVSTSGNWWFSTNSGYGNITTPVYDRTHETDNSKYGYFLYIDAADESRKIATLSFDATLCVGSQMIFSAAVADLTAPGSERAQVLFKLYGVDNDGNRHLINSFSSGGFNTNTSANLAKWYQVYGKVYNPAEVINYTHFVLDLINMCTSTDGADYAIDDIRIYQKSSDVDVIQTSPVCPEEGTTAATATFKLRSYYETMKSLRNDEGKLYYKFYDVTDSKWVDQVYEVSVPASKEECTSDQIEMVDGDTYFIITVNKFDGLVQSHQYAVFMNTVNDSWDASKNSQCSIFSDNFVIIKESLLIPGSEDLLVKKVLDCSADGTEAITVTASLKTVDSIYGNEVTLEEGQVVFDWFVSNRGESNDFATIKEDNVTLQDALRGLRDIDPNGTTLKSSFAEYNSTNENFTEAHYNLLKKYVYTSDNTSGRLVLSANQTFSTKDYSLGGGDYEIAAIPVTIQVKDGESTYIICPSPLMFKLSVTQQGGPTLIIGVKDVTYPEDYVRVVRIGLPQLKALKASNGVLNIPISKASHESLTKLKGDEKIYVTVEDTKDPVFPTADTKIATVENENGIAYQTQDNLQVKFTDNAVNVLHEGYAYTVNIDFAASGVACTGTATFILKIVPEYLTWTSNTENNANWNNDSNWIRSTVAELHKDTQNSDSYADYHEGTSTSEVYRVEGAFVPMKFSKVTVKEFATGSTGFYPSLGSVTKSTTQGSSANGYLIENPLDKYGNKSATENIEYDLAATWKKNAAQINGTDDGTNLSCEPFYANTCEQIYFKPRAELLGQQYLNYEKAWVEKELTPKTWSLMASPLQETYAGDMYVPYATGQQDTEAFQSISWGNDYSRNNYPFYQKNWDRSGKEVAAGSSWEAYDQSTADADITKNEVKYAVGYWSHVYNDVTESYAGAKAFVVKAGDEYNPSTEVASNKAIVRLPKADTSYTYYDYNGGSSSVIGTTTKTANAHKFVVTQNDGSFTETLNTNATEGNQYYLVGNPYTASLNVKAFLKGNSSNFDASGIWTLNNGTMEAKTVGENTIIEPMGAFFVKAANDTKPSTATFTSEMTVDGHNASASTNPAKTRASETVGEDETIVLTASSVKSSMATCASVIVRSDAYAEYENGEDVETLYNGDLDDAPTVYTVASNQAVSVNAVPSMELIPMGVVSKESEDVTIAVSKADNVDVYLFDAKTKTSTLLYSGDSITVQSNAHGRYYLSSKAIDINDRTNNDVKVYSPANGIITVATTMSDVMQSVELFSADGKKVAQEAVNGESSKDFYVSGGLYIVKVTTSNGVKTQKVAVK